MEQIPYVEICVSHQSEQIVNIYKLSYMLSSDFLGNNKVMIKIANKKYSVEFYCSVNKL